MKLLFTSYYFPPDFRGGAEISAFNVGKALVEDGHTVHVLTRGGDVAYDDRFTVHDDLPEREMPRERIERSTRTHVSDLIDTYDFDMVHAQNAYTAVGAIRACENTTTRCAASLRDYWLLDPLRLCYDFLPGEYSTSTHPGTLLQRAWTKYSYDGLQKQLASPLILLYLERLRRHARKHVRKADALIANSDFMRDLHSDLPGDIKRVYNSIDTTRFSPAPVDTDGKTHVLFVGRPRPEKGVETLLRAVQRLQADHPDLVLDIVGTDTPPPWMEGVIEALGIGDRVMFHGRVPFDELVDWYNRTDIVAFPSAWQEPFGRVPMEAMACGTPVIATKVGGVPEVVGDAGVLIRPGSSKQLSAQLRLLADDQTKRKELGEKGRERVEQMFAADVIAENQLKCYRSI